MSVTNCESDLSAGRNSTTGRPDPHIQWAGQGLSRPLAIVWPVTRVDAGRLLDPLAARCARMAAVTEMRLYDVRVTVERIEGRSVCGLQVGDWFEVTESSRVRIPEGGHFCLFAMQSVFALLPAKMRRLADEDWLERDSFVACPDPDERLVMRIDRIGERTLVTEELT